MKISFKLILLLSLTFTQLNAQKNKPKSKSDSIINPLLKSETYSNLIFRSIGPAVTSGRIIDIAIHPKNLSIWYIAAACGGVFKTTNSGTSF